MKKKKQDFKKKLNIAHLHWGFPPIIGGVETHLTILLPMLAKRGHNVSLLTGSMEGVKAEDNYKGADIYRMPVMDLNWLYKRGVHGLEKEVVDVFKNFIEKVKPDIIHAHNMHYFSKIHAEALQGLSVEKGIPLILTAHNVWDDNLFLDLTRDIKWSHIIAVSHFIKKEIMGVGLNHKNISVVYHGIDQQAYNPRTSSSSVLKKYPILKNKKVVFHPARMGLAKGCDVSIKAFSVIKKRFPNVVLVLAGTKNIIDWGEKQQKDIAYMVNLVNFLGLRDNVLIDSYHLDEMPGLYASSDVCIYPSSSCEPFGLTMLEALASGKPMVVTRTGGMPEIIKDDINGFIIPVKDYEMLASRTLQLLEDDDLRERFGSDGREMVEQQFTKEIVTKNNLNIYRKFC